MTAPNSAMKNSFLRFWRSSARQGSRFIRGMLVEAPQREPAGGQQRGRVPIDALGFGATRNLHLSQRITDRRRDANSATDDVGDARDVGAAAAHENLIRLLTTAARGEEELQRATDLLR